MREELGGGKWSGHITSSKIPMGSLDAFFKRHLDGLEGGSADGKVVIPHIL